MSLLKAHEIKGSFPVKFKYCLLLCTEINVTFSYNIYLIYSIQTNNCVDKVNLHCTNSCKALRFNSLYIFLLHLIIYKYIWGGGGGVVG